MTLKPFNSGYLKEQDGHQVWFAEYGNPQGPAIVNLHGGPGSKSKPKHIKGFELDRYRVIVFDQRGCGQSTPIGETKQNTLKNLIADMERLREELSINSWFVAGGSWGSTLALAYAQSYPDKVLGLLLASIFLARKRDDQWAFSKSSGVDRLFPDLWERRDEFFKQYQTNPTDAAKDLLEKLLKANEDEAKAIVAGVSNWEGNLMNAQADVSLVEAEDVEESDIAMVTIFLHYQTNNFFLDDNQLLDNMEKIKDIPAVLVHGRYDILCPLEQMWEVQKLFTNSQVVILPTSNHKLTADGEVAKDLAYNYFLSKHT